MGKKPKDQEWSQTEQQFRETIRKLQASEKELMVANQQLAMSEEELTAANEQLAASEEELRVSNLQLTEEVEHRRRAEEKLFKLQDLLQRTERIGQIGGREFDVETMT